MWSEIAAVFREFMGTGLIVVLYLFCLVYLYLKEEKKYVRILFIYIPIGILLLFFNPLFAQLVYRAADEEIYYRILWLLPVTAGIAYTACHIIGKLQGKVKYGAAVGTAVIIMISGRCVYDSPYFTVAENLYHVPDSVVHICDSIIVPGREVMAAFPGEMLQYVRQYSSFVCMPYGRETLVERWNAGTELSQIMEQEPLNLEAAVPLLREQGCHYVILRAGRQILGDLKEFGWEIFGETDGYVIYRDTGIPLVIPEL